MGNELLVSEPPQVGVWRWRAQAVVAATNTPDHTARCVAAGGVAASLSFQIGDGLGWIGVPDYASCVACCREGLKMQLKKINKSYQ